jgi:hypothetical protein
LTVRFRADGEPTARPAFIGDETLLASVRRVLALRHLSVTLSVGSVIHPAPSATRRGVALIAGKAVGCAG